MKASPDYVRVSLAAAMTLRFTSGRFYRNAKLFCINLLLTYDDGCVGNCAYCGLQRQREGEFNEKSFIRVNWDIYPLSEIIKRLSLNYAPWVERICISMITHRNAFKDTVEILRRIKKELNEIGVSLLICPTVLNKEKLKIFKEEGADMVGIAIDLARGDLFSLYRGSGVKGPHRYDKYWECVEDALDIFGKSKVGVHLIVGLGETQKDMVWTIKRVFDLGARVHLFSFYPEEGSLLKDRPKCDEVQYRKIQIARYLIEEGLSSFGQMRFDKDGEIIDFGIDKERLLEVIERGEAFMTTGCPGKTLKVACNRPFGDGPPSDIRSFPFKPNKKDTNRIKKLLKL